MDNDDDDDDDVADDDDDDDDDDVADDDDADDYVTDVMILLQHFQYSTYGYLVNYASIRKKLINYRPSTSTQIDERTDKIIKPESHSSNTNNAGICRFCILFCPLLHQRMDLRKERICNARERRGRERGREREGERERERESERERTHSLIYIEYY